MAIRPTRLQQALAQLHDLIANDIPGLEFRLWACEALEGAEHDSEAGLELILAMTSPLSDGQAIALWTRFRGNWERFLTRELALPCRMGLYRGADVTPGLHAALQGGAELIYRSHPERPAG